VLSVLAIVLVWHIMALVSGDDLLPGPIQVMKRIWAVMEDGTLLGHLGITLRRVVFSFTIAMIIGTAVGMVMGSREKFDAVLDGLLIFGLNIPALVVIILCYIWFGLTEIAAIVAVSVNKIPMVIVTLREGARSVDRDLMEVARVYKVPRIETFTKVYMPQLYPYLLVAARNGLALIWKIVLVVELLGRSDGVGFQLGTFFQFFDIEGILAYTFAFIFVILLFEAVIMRPLENHLARWRT
jgi:NitT/TauT family transport system permease protein